MRVGMDISQIAHGGGVGVYTEHLAKELVSLGSFEMVFFYSLLRKSYRGDLPNVKTFRIPPTILEPLFNRLRLPIEFFIGSVDVFHSTDWIQPKTSAKKVTTFHDIIPLKYPEWSHPKVVEVHRRRLRLVEKEIDFVIAVSKATKKDLLEITGIPEEKIVVIYEGVNKLFKPQEESDIGTFKKKKNLPERFILAIGGVGERKNLARIREASKKHNLVILGEHLKGISDEEMPLLYSSATLLAYPSLYEGFGLPILEAMACGTPVITSNTSSMPEVGGEAVEYVNPESVIDIENAIRRLMEDGRRRKVLIKKGFEQAKKFSWKKCAEETAEVYKKVHGLA